MAARVQIVIEAKDASSGILRAITGQLGDFGGLMEELTAKNVNWGNVTERAATMAINAVKDAINVTQEYAQEVRDQALASGQGAEAASRFLQVLDDYQLSADDAKTATRAMTREGLAPTVETIAKLSAEYQKLNTAEEKNAFVQKNLGRAGQEWLNLLDQGPDKIMAMNDAVSKSLILTQQNIKAYEENRLALDQWDDSVKAFKIHFGNEMLPVVTDVVNSLNAAQRAQEILGDKFNASVIGTKAWNEALKQAREEQDLARDSVLQYSDTMDAAQIKMSEYGVVIQELAQVDYKSLISSIQSAQNETDRYASKTADLTAKKKELLDGIEALKKRGYREEGQTIQDERKKLDDLDKQLDENAKAHQQWAAQTVFAFAQARAAADGEITQGEGEILIAMGEQLGLFDEKTAEAMESVNKSFDNLDASNAKDTVKSVQDALVALTGQTWVINIVTDTSGVYLPSAPKSYETMPLCFIGGTLVRTPDGEKPIETIQEGETVLAYDLKEKKCVEAKVTKVFHHEAGEMVDNSYLRINNIGVTKEHPFYANGKWIKAQDLHIGDELLGFDGKTAIVTRIVGVYRRVKTYNLEVEKEHNYFAGGVLVHNKLQSGGLAYAGAPTLVGEAGPEPFIPAVNGRVLGHAESLHALSLGGGGNNMYFYGNVSISPDSEGGGDMLSIR